MMFQTRNSTTASGPTKDTLVAGYLSRRGLNPRLDRVTLPSGASTFLRMAVSPATEQDAENSRGYENYSLSDCVRAMLGSAGYDIGRAHVGYLLHLYRQDNRSFSTSDIGAFLTEVFGGMFVAGYEGGADTTEGWCAEGENIHLKPMPRPRLSNTVLTKRGSGQSAESVTLEAVGEYTSIAEYSGKFEIDEQDLINDQFGAVEKETPQMLGKAARRLRPDLVYAHLMSNPNMRDDKPLFHADHGNLITGAPLGVSSLQSALAAMSRQIENGVDLNLRGRYLLVPPALEVTAKAVARELEQKEESATPGIIVRSEARLENGVTDPDTGEHVAGSSNTWYVSAEAEHTIEVSYLVGSDRLPRIRQGVMVGGDFGMWFDVLHHVGVKALDWRGLVRVDG